MLAAMPVGAHAPVPDPVAVRGDQCVAPVEVMRREHMDMLMHQRDETVERGVRGAAVNLVGCVSCHADRDDHGNYLRVDAPGQFCATCHAYAAVEMDCFECHAAKPHVEENAHHLHDDEERLAFGELSRRWQALAPRQR